MTVTITFLPAACIPPRTIEKVCGIRERGENTIFEMSALRGDETSEDQEVPNGIVQSMTVLP